MGNTIFDKLANHIQLETGYSVVFGDDELLDEDRNQTRGVLRISQTNRGLDKEIITTTTSCYVDFVVKLEEKDEFYDRVNNYINSYQGSGITPDDNQKQIYRLYFSNFMPSSLPTKVQGSKYVTYILELDLVLYDNAMHSDDTLITIDGKPLGGILNWNETSTFNREPKSYDGSKIPYGVGCTKVRAYKLTYLPIIGDEASNTLFDIHNTLSEKQVTLGVEFPIGNPIINKSVKVSVQDFSLNLQKGTFAQVSVDFVEYKDIKD